MTPTRWCTRRFPIHASVPPTEFRRAFEEYFPRGSIDAQTKIPERPNLIIFQLTIPLEQRTDLEEFLQAFCEHWGFPYYELDVELGPIVKKALSLAKLDQQRRRLALIEFDHLAADSSQRQHTVH